jgi:hypothetical protein
MRDTQQRILARVATRLFDQAGGAGDRFDRMVMTRRSWQFWFVGRVAIARAKAARR